MADGFPKPEDFPPDTAPYPPGPYDVIVADPPWPVDGMLRTTMGETEDVPYKKMSLDAIRSIPIDRMIDYEGWVFLWCPNRFIPAAFGLLADWDLHYRFTMAWHKGTGFKPWNYPTLNTEFVVVGTAKKPVFADTKNFYSSLDFANPKLHSAKPGWFYHLLERVCGSSARRLDLFARKRRSGWDSYGDELEPEDATLFIP